jgi:hypothetical protein
MTEPEQDAMRVMIMMLAVRLADDDGINELDDDTYPVWRNSTELIMLTGAKILGMDIGNLGTVQ